jgi:predicted RNA binding protein YcfA (HicA-like mRNA interferase family)
MNTNPSKSIKGGTVPRKVRQFKKELRDLGFDWRPGKGQHQVWNHPLIPSPIVIADKDGADTPEYLERQLKKVLALLEEQNNL